MRLPKLFSKDMGVDLGTANVLVYARGKGIVVREPSVVAVRSDGSREVLAVGEEAKSMIGRTPGNIIAVRPLQDGVIADFDVTEAMLRHFIRKGLAISGGSTIFSRPRVVICVPCGVTDVEKRAVDEAARHCGASDVYLIEEPMAAAIGAGLPVQDATGSMIVDIGGGTSEVAVISLGGVVASQSIRVGGNKLDDSISNYLKKEHNLAVGDRTAEEIKISIGSAFPMKTELMMDIRGRDLITGLPATLTITSTEIYHALREPVGSIVEAIKQTLEITPPELSSDIMQRGITLSGGGALLSGLDMLINYETGIPVLIADSPLDCVALGAGMVVEDLELLDRISRTDGV